MTGRTMTPETALREAAADLYRLARDGHGHDETHTADWPSCLPAHIAMARYRKAIAAYDAAVPDAPPAIDVERLARAMAIAADLARRAAPRRGWAKQAASIAHEYAALAPSSEDER